MRVLLTAAVLLVLGMIGIIVMHERRDTRPPSATATDESIAVATISTGQRVDIDAHVARRGLTIVEFTADF